jgi:hypothetical protein
MVPQDERGSAFFLHGASRQPVSLRVYLSCFTADKGSCAAIALRNDVHGRVNPQLAHK